MAPEGLSNDVFSVAFAGDKALANKNDANIVSSFCNIVHVFVAHFKHEPILEQYFSQIPNKSDTISLSVTITSEEA